LTSNDPTDQALAVIASIFEKPEAKRDDDGARAPDEVADAPEPGEPGAPSPQPSEDAAAAEQPAATDPADAAATDAVEPASDPRSDPGTDLESYTRYGPGPLDALRFKWSLRRGDSGYYVDETIGASSQPISSGPMSRDAAIAFIETRDRASRRRFEELRNEIVMGPSERGYDEDDNRGEDER
jgi:pyruvate/2-oxoglutarate dehydrogenase complex dihydrolipoamide acyltransferase (E2) component